MLIVLIMLIDVRCLMVGAASSLLGTSPSSNVRLAKLTSDPSVPLTGAVLSM
jgi:hypothetical protein